MQKLEMLRRSIARAAKARQHYAIAVYRRMRCSDETRRVTITALDRLAFAVSANLATSPLKSYQQGFIPFECLS